MTAINRVLIAFLFSASLGAFAGEDLPGPEQNERDVILSLTALAVVYRDWQEPPGRRGHNIGSVLADKDSMPVFWARNTVNMSGNASQHGEMRLVQEFLDCQPIGSYAQGYTVYTTLEPCAMCTGMMALTRVSRAVYVQSDPEYGHARDALVSIGYPHVFAQYSPPGMAQKLALDAGYKNFKIYYPRAGITNYLLSRAARKIFASAETELQSYQVKFTENQRVLESALAFVKNVPTQAGDDRPSDYCPAK